MRRAPAFGAFLLRSAHWAMEEHPFPDSRVVPKDYLHAAIGSANAHDVLRQHGAFQVIGLSGR
jgi:hypothetical protein